MRIVMLELMHGLRFVGLWPYCFGCGLPMIGTGLYCEQCEQVMANAGEPEVKR